MKRTIRLLWIVLALPVLPVSVPAQPNTAIIPEPRLIQFWGGQRNESWIGRHEAIVQRVRRGGVDMLHIGDSITHGWEYGGRAVWDRYYGHRNAVNLGFGGDRTEHVLWRLLNGEIDGIDPKLAVVMIGTNNSGSNTPKEIAQGITATCYVLQAKLPRTKILLLAIFPRGEHPDRRRAVCEETNTLIAKLADNERIFYLDIGNSFLQPDGTLPKTIMPDFLHPNLQGYKIWAAAVEPMVAKLMGDTPVRPE